MATSREKIKTLEGALALGFDLTMAIQRALGTSLTAFANEHGYSVPAVSMCLRGYSGRVYPDIRDAICETLDIPREYLDRLIDEQREAA